MGCGVQGGTRVVDHLRLILAEVRAAVVPTQVALSVLTDFDFSGFDPTDPTAAGILAPGESQEETLSTLLTEVAAWSQALRSLRPADPSPGDHVPLLTEDVPTGRLR